VLAVLVCSALLVGCGGEGPDGQRAMTTKTAHPTPAIVGAPGRIVGIGGGRSLFLHCVGSGGPTVVLEAGLGGNTFNWREVQPQLGRITRTCAYDRAGIGNSVARPGVHDARDEIDDLQRLLDHAHIDPPYVLVGHSYGGLLARLFAQAQPAEVVGIVLVDAMGRDQTRRMLAVWPKSQAREVRRTQATPVRDGVDLATGEALASRVSSLGDVPLAVVTAGSESWQGAPRRLARVLDREWATMQDELAALSPDHVHVVALRSDHFVQGADGQPLVVIRAVRAVLDAARDGAHLPPCAELFTGNDVRCRD
jgi:pimeloyl-ACP methyl ester carboxylesterase